MHRWWSGHRLRDRAALSEAVSTTARPSLAGPIAALSIAAFASACSMRVCDALLPTFSGLFGVSLGDASGAVTFFSIAYGLSQLLFGPLGDRFGKYLVIAFACGASTLTALACAFAPSFPLLLIARLMAGATAAAVVPLSMAWIGDAVPYEERQPVLGKFLIGQVLGVSTGSWLGGFTADHLPWQAPFVAIASLFACVCAVLFAFDRRLPAHARLRGQAQGSALRRMTHEFGQVLAKPWSRVVLTCVFIEGACLFGALAFVPSHLHRVHGTALSIAGAIAMLFGVGGLLYAAGSSIWVRRLGEIGLASVGAVLMALALMLTGLASVWWWAIPGCFVAGLGFYMLHNTLQIHATQMAPERRGAAVSSFACCYFLGQAAGVGMAGQWIKHDPTGTTAVIVVGALGVLIIGSVFARRLARRAMHAAAATTV